MKQKGLVEEVKDLLEQSVIMRFIITLASLGLLTYCIVREAAVPDQLWIMVGAVVTFYFGTEAVRAFLRKGT